MALGPFEPSLRRMRAAIDLLEAALERRARRDAQRGDADEELALMQDDRARLAVELDSALDRGRALEAAQRRGGQEAGAGKRGARRTDRAGDPDRRRLSPGAVGAKGEERGARRWRK